MTHGSVCTALGDQEPWQNPSLVAQIRYHRTTTSVEANTSSSRRQALVVRCRVGAWCRAARPRHGVSRSAVGPLYCLAGDSTMKAATSRRPRGLSLGSGGRQELGRRHPACSVPSPTPATAAPSAAPGPRPWPAASPPTARRPGRPAAAASPGARRRPAARRATAGPASCAAATGATAGPPGPRSSALSEDIRRCGASARRERRVGSGGTPSTCCRRGRSLLFRGSADCDRREVLSLRSSQQGGPPTYRRESASATANGEPSTCTKPARPGPFAWGSTWRQSLRGEGVGDVEAPDAAGWARWSSRSECRRHSSAVRLP